MANQQLLHSYSSISGAWVLDLSRSDTMEGYLRCLRTPEEAIRQQVEAEQDLQTRNVIALNGSTLIIHKRTTTSGTFTESFVLGEERITQARFGMRRSIVTLGPSRTMNEFIKTSAFTSNGGNAVVVEERRLVEQGLAHLQEITLRNQTTGEEHLTNRFWTRVPMTNDDQRQLTAG
ncbi:unnamed protein product [Ascophyllum nodosum]